MFQVCARQLTSQRQALISSNRRLIPSPTSTSSSTLAVSGFSSNNQLIIIRERSNRSRRGLYDGKDIRSGNNVSFSMRATKRKFRPNVQKKRVYSEILDEMVRFHLTTSTLRSIDKAGGLDNYIMKNDFTEGEGYAVKKRMMAKLKEMEKTKAVEESQTAFVEQPSA